MDQTTKPAYHTFYYYPDDATYTGDLDDLLQWVEDQERVVVNGQPIDPSSDDYYHDRAHERGFVHSANIGTIITVSNILVNLILIFLVLLRKSFRTQLAYQQVVNLALADLAFSVIVDPFTVYFELQPWRLGPGFCVAWMVLDAALPFVSFLVLIMLNLDRLFFAVCPTLYHAACRHTLLRALVLLVPWVLALGVVLPLWLLTAVAWPQLGMCIYGITKKAAVISACLSLFLPCVVLIVLTVLVLVTIIGGMPQDLTNLFVNQDPITYPWPPQRYREQQQHPQHLQRLSKKPYATNTIHVCSNLTRDGSLDSSGSGGRGGCMQAEDPEVRKSHRCLVVAICVLNLLTVITQLPYGAISILEPECVEAECQSTIKLIQALSWTRSTTFSLHPVFLILLTKLRHAFCRLCGDKDPESGLVRTATGNSGNNSGNTKSDQVELTSTNSPPVQVKENSSITML